MIKFEANPGFPGFAFFLKLFYGNDLKLFRISCRNFGRLAVVALRGGYGLMRYRYKNMFLFCISLSTAFMFGFKIHDFYDSDLFSDIKFNKNSTFGAIIITEKEGKLYDAVKKYVKLFPKHYAESAKKASDSLIAGDTMSNSLKAMNHAFTEGRQRDFNKLIEPLLNKVLPSNAEIESNEKLRKKAILIFDQIYDASFSVHKEINKEN